jgi:hypothetical protein
MVTTRSAHSKTRVVVLVDTPNITKSAFRQSNGVARADYRRILQYARSIGVVCSAVALVNDGVNPRFSVALQKMGYDVRPSHAFDCDDAVIAWGVRLHTWADCFIICSGDKGYYPLVRLLQSIGAKVIICAAENSCNRRLREASNTFVGVPIEPLPFQPTVLRSAMLQAGLATA